MLILSASVFPFISIHSSECIYSIVNNNLFVDIIKVNHYLKRKHLEIPKSQRLWSFRVFSLFFFLWWISLDDGHRNSYFHIIRIDLIFLCMCRFLFGWLKYEFHLLFIILFNQHFYHFSISCRTNAAIFVCVCVCVGDWIVGKSHSHWRLDSFGRQPTATILFDMRNSLWSVL